MGYIDPTPLIDRIAEAVSQLRRVVADNYQYLPEEFRNQFMADLDRQVKDFESSAEQLQS
jgi:predicted Zn-dependent protease with MMP-like domain